MAILGLCSGQCSMFAFGFHREHSAFAPLLWFSRSFFRRLLQRHSQFNGEQEDCQTIEIKEFKPRTLRLKVWGLQVVEWQCAEEPQWALECSHTSLTYILAEVLQKRQRPNDCQVKTILLKRRLPLDCGNKTQINRTNPVFTRRSSMSIFYHWSSMS